MLNLEIESEREAYERLIEAAKNMDGINFALAMRDGDGIKIYKRENQPCQGGEMRKYARTHTDCTRPQDKRPGDLEHPFPKGIPEGVARSYQGFLRRDIADALLSSQSPYRKAVGPNVTIIPSSSNPELVQGIVFLDTDVDSTLFVNLLQTINTFGYTQTLKNMTECGLGVDETLCAMMLLNLENPVHCVTLQSDYYWNPYASSIRRILEGDAHDLTGGTFRNRFDYNRPEVQDLFKAVGDETKTNLFKECEKKGLFKVVEKTYGNGSWAYTVKSNTFESMQEFCDGVHEILQDALSREKKRLESLNEGE